MTIAKVAGRIRRGGRRKADLATVSKAAIGFPVLACRNGFKAHTYPVRKAKMVTPMRPCHGTRMNGSWRNLGLDSSLSRGDQRS